MKAFVATKYKKNLPLQLVEMPRPSLGERDILVEVKAASVNQLDLKIRDGAFKLILPYKTPFILGHDVSGIIRAVGPLVKKFHVGDEVYSRPRDYRQGAFSEYLSIHEDDAAFKPRNLSFEEAASIPLVGLTAWQALVESGRLGPGQKVFIQAGSGGVGTFAIQLAKSLGAFVATTTSAANIPLTKSLGADLVIDYKKEDFETILSGYDLVLHSQDQKNLLASLKVLKAGGRLISISGPPDPGFARELHSTNLVLRAAISLLSFKARRMSRQLKIHYSFLFMRASATQLEEISKLVEKGSIKPTIDRVFHFEDTNDALFHVGSGRAKGKVVVTFEEKKSINHSKE